MKVNHLIRISAGVIWLVGLMCFASSPVWNGTWKLNVSKSSNQAPDFIVTTLPTGEYHTNNGSYSYTFRCDGKEYPMSESRAISCTQANPSTMDRIIKDNGKKTAEAHWELSADARTLTTTTKSVSTKADGSMDRIEKVYSRISGSGSFAGGWKDTKRLESQPPLAVTLTARSLHLASQAVDMDPPLDGADAPIHGPGIPPGTTINIKPNGPLEFLIARKVQGQVFSQGVLRLSADGRTLVEEVWPANRPNQKATLVYEKQMATPLTAHADEWKKYEERDGNFSVLFPREPKDAPYLASREGIESSHGFSASDGSVYVGVFYANMKQEQKVDEANYRIYKKGFFNGLPTCKELNSTVASPAFPGYISHGYRLDCDAPNSGAPNPKGTLIVNLYFGRHFSYVIVAGFATKTDPPTVKKFVDSFSVTDVSK